MAPCNFHQFPIHAIPNKNFAKKVNCSKLGGRQAEVKVGMNLMDARAGVERMRLRMCACVRMRACGECFTFLRIELSRRIIIPLKVFWKLRKIKWQMGIGKGSRTYYYYWPSPGLPIGQRRECGLVLVLLP